MKRAPFALVALPLFFMLAAAPKKAAWQPAASGTNTDASVCGQIAPMAGAAADGKFIPILSGLVKHRYPVHTASDSAQLYFDQGLALYYSYHFPEALASFKEVARFDANCTMAYWGQALALGPYYNIYKYKMNREVPGVLATLQRANTGAVQKESALINAMAQRYSADTTNADRPQLDRNYAGAMKKLTIAYPADNDIKALYIDAVMLCHKWDFWNNEGTPKPWTTELISLSQAVLKANPQHPAALHYYIHLTEASRTPARMLPYADALKELMPGVSHMVHMATHAYQRNGLFAKGVTVNEKANEVNNNVNAVAPNLNLGRDNLIHVFAVQSYCAMNAGMYKKGLPVYNRVRERLMAQRPAFKTDPYAQFVYMLPQVAMVRLGKWHELLKQPRPDTNWVFAIVLDDFAKGMAYVRTNNIPMAKKCLSSLNANLTDSLLAIRRMPFNKPVQPALIGSAILSGEILYAEGKTSAAIAMFKVAVAEEDKLIYREPQDWFIPARQYLGYYWLKTNMPLEAAKVYKADLLANPGNGWSLRGMYNCMVAQHKASQALLYKQKFQKAFAVADNIPSGSVY
nr:hypothetical protein [uncultured Mucilaginibacter sp.]